MEIVCIRKHTAHILGNALEPDLFVVGHNLLLLLNVIKIIESFLSILKDNFGLLLDLSLKSRE